MDKAEMMIMAQRLRQLGPLLEMHDPFRYKGLGEAIKLPQKPEDQILRENLVPMENYRVRAGRV